MSKKKKKKEERRKMFTLTEIHIFLKYFIHQEERKRADWLLWVSRLGSEFLLAVAEMHQLAAIAKDPEIHKLLKDLS